MAQGGHGSAGRGLGHPILGPRLAIPEPPGAVSPPWVYLGQPRPLDQVIELPEGGVSGQRLNVFEEVLLLGLEELAVVGDEERVGPEGADVHPDHLGGVDDLPQGPHEGPVDPHQLLGLDLVGLVQHHADLVLMVLERLDDFRELVGDVQLVGVKEQDDAVHPLSEPLKDGREVVTCGKRRASQGRQGPGGLMALAPDLAWYFSAWGHLNFQNVLMWTAQCPEGRFIRPPLLPYPPW